MRLYHGTTYENYQEILKRGFDDTHRVWIDSDTDSIYFHSPEEDSEDKADVLRTAYWNACVAGAVFDTKQDYVVILEMEIPEEFVEPDYSCPSATHQHQVRIHHLNLEMIQAIHIGNFRQKFKMLYLVHTNHQILEPMELTSGDLQILDALKDTNTVYELLFDSEIRQVGLTA